MYAQVGVLFYGGRLYQGDAYELSSGADVLYTYCNFNDFGSAFVTLFELLVVNNWQVIMEEVAVVAGPWSRTFFISWWLLSVLVMSNLLIAFILENMVGDAVAADDDEPAEPGDAPLGSKPRGRGDAPADSAPADSAPEAASVAPLVASSTAETTATAPEPEPEAGRAAPAPEAQAAVPTVEPLIAAEGGGRVVAGR